MNAKEQLEQTLIISLMPVIPSDSMEEAKARILMSLADYDVTKNETLPVVYEGDINEQMLKRFIAAKVAAGRTPRTIRFYLITIKKVLEDINKPYNEVTSDDVRMYMARRLMRDKVSKVTINNEYRAMSTFYKWLQIEGIVRLNPFAKLEQMKVTKLKKRAYSLIDLEKIRYGCRTNRERAIVEMLASTWCRVSELVEIKIADIETDKVVVHGKGDKYRQVYINARAQLALKAYLDERKDSNPYLFCKANGTVLNNPYLRAGGKTDQGTWYKHVEAVSESEPIDKSTVESIVRKIGRRAGVQNVHPHRFRRTGATMALRAGMPIITVSKLLGHENIQTTQIYLDVSDEELEAMHRKYVT